MALGKSDRSKYFFMALICRILAVRDCKRYHKYRIDYTESTDDDQLPYFLVIDTGFLI